MRPSEREKMLAKARKVRERKQSTYDEVPSGRLTSRVQKAKDALDGRKGAKATSGTVLTFKDTGSGKGPDPSNLAGKGGRGTGLNLAKKTKTPDEMAAAAKKKRNITAKVTAAEKKAAPKKSAANTKPFASGKVSFKTAFANARKAGTKIFSWNGKKYTTEVAKAKPKAKVSTPTPADFTMTGKKAAPKKSAPKSKDPRGNQIKATPGKAKSALPAGAKPFKGSYNSKTHKLQNIKGKTYVVPRGK